jgi:3-hydroxybutyryl-coA dehydratase
MSFVTTEIQDAVAVLTIDRPKALNALNPEVLADLKAAFEAIDQNAVRCVVLTGAGDKSFVAGADIGSMSTMTKAEGEAFGKLGNDVFLMIEHFPLPVIAAVNGFALGGGNELAMSCDIVSRKSVWVSPRASAAPSVWHALSAWAWPSSSSTLP